MLEGEGTSAGTGSPWAIKTHARNYLYTQNNVMSMFGLSTSQLGNEISLLISRHWAFVSKKVLNFCVVVSRPKICGAFHQEKMYRPKPNFYFCMMTGKNCKFELDAV
jgi:hypothetical protein